MFSIQKWFAKDDQFFKLLAASAQAGRDSVQTLKDILHSTDAAGKLEDLAAARRKDKEITGRITALLARTSVTSLDPEDIEAISTALNKIPKTVHKFAERYLIGAQHLRGIDFTAQIALAERATGTVTEMIGELEKSQFERVNASNERLQTIEGEADRLMVELFRDFYSGKYPPMTVTILKDLYELLERVIDRCRDAGNVTATVVLKHS
jgi:hypothetical protein